MARNQMHKNWLNETICWQLLSISYWLTASIGLKSNIEQQLDYYSEHNWDQLFTVGTIWNIGETGDIHMALSEGDWYFNHSDPLPLSHVICLMKLLKKTYPPSPLCMKWYLNIPLKQWNKLWNKFNSAHSTFWEKPRQTYFRCIFLQTGFTSSSQIKAHYFQCQNIEPVCELWNPIVTYLSHHNFLYFSLSFILIFWVVMWSHLLCILTG